MVEQLSAAFVNLRDVVGPFWTLCPQLEKERCRACSTTPGRAVQMCLSVLAFQTWRNERGPRLRVSWGRAFRSSCLCRTGARSTVGHVELVWVLACHLLVVKPGPSFLP